MLFQLDISKKYYTVRDVLIHGTVPKNISYENNNCFIYSKLMKSGAS